MLISPLVSVIIPVFNGANYLGKAIESALGQTHSNLEVIVVDDGSSDHGDTERITRSFGPPVKYIKKSNGGVSSALNLGIAQMQGEYFSWLSHDDLYYPQKTSVLLEYLELAPTAQVVGCGLDVIDSNGSIRDTHTFPGCFQVRNAKALLETWIFGCGLLIRRSVFDRVGLFDESNRSAQDLDMWLRVVDVEGPIHMIPEVLCAWRHHSESGSFSQRAEHFAEMEIFFQKILERYPLSFFSSGPTADASTDRAETLDWLGEQARHRGAIKFARRMFFRAALTNPRLLDSRTWQRLRKSASSLRLRAT